MVDVTKIKAGDKVIVACGETELTVESVKRRDSLLGGFIIKYVEGYEINYIPSEAKNTNEPLRIIKHIPQEPPFDWADAKSGMCFKHNDRQKVWYIGRDFTNSDYVVGTRTGVEIDKADISLYYKYNLGRFPEGDIRQPKEKKTTDANIKRINKSLEVKIHDEREEMTWDEAIEKFDNNPESEWRLPTRAEMRRMHEDSGVTGFSCGWYATSTKNSYGAVAAFNLYEKESMYGEEDEDYLIRLVRK